VPAKFSGIPRKIRRLALPHGEQTSHRSTCIFTKGRSTRFSSGRTQTGLGGAGSTRICGSSASRRITRALAAILVIKIEQTACRAFRHFCGAGLGSRLFGCALLRLAFLYDAFFGCGLLGLALFRSGFPGLALLHCSFLDCTLLRLAILCLALFGLAFFCSHLFSPHVDRMWEEPD